MAKKRVATSQDGSLTLACKDMEIRLLLEDIAAAVGIQIYLFDKPGQERISLDVSKKKVQEILRSVLRDYDYAVVYCSDQQSEGGIFVMSEDESGKAPLPNQNEVGKRRAANTQEEDENSSLRRKAMIESQIAHLEKRLANGFSDEVYERWAKIRGSDFVTHDRERVGQLKEKVSVLSQSK